MSGPLPHGPGELRPGTRFRTRGRTVTETDVVSFATLTGDFHPVHTDVEWAAESEFGGRIVHGALLLSYSVGLLAFDPERVLALRGFERVVFKRPVRIGDTIAVEGRVEAERELDAHRRLVVLDLKIVNQRGEGVALATARVLWRGPTQAAPEAPEAERQEVYL